MMPAHLSNVDIIAELRSLIIFLQKLLPLLHTHLEISDQLS